MTIKFFSDQGRFIYISSHQRDARGHQVAHKDQVRCPQACYKNYISMINVFTITNINTKIINDKQSKIFISEVCIKLVALHINRHTGSTIARSFEKVGDPWFTWSLSKYSNFEPELEVGRVRA